MSSFQIPGLGSPVDASPPPSQASPATSSGLPPTSGGLPPRPPPPALKEEEEEEEEAAAPSSATSAAAPTAPSSTHQPVSEQEKAHEDSTAQAEDMIMSSPTPTPPLPPSSQQQPSYDLAPTGLNTQADNPPIPITDPPTGPPTRFELELEFITMLASPPFLAHLASSSSPTQQKLLHDPAFINYLRYLRYWRREEYVRFLRYPAQSLGVLELLVGGGSGIGDEMGRGDGKRDGEVEMGEGDGGERFRDDLMGVTGGWIVREMMEQGVEAARRHAGAEG